MMVQVALVMAPCGVGGSGDIQGEGWGWALLRRFSKPHKKSSQEKVRLTEANLASQ